MKRVCGERRVRSATVWGCMLVLFIFVSGCASTRGVGEPQVETASPPPVVDPAPGPPTGPPPGHVEPKVYWVRERIILGEVPTVIEIERPLPAEPALPASAPQKSLGQKGKKHTKTGKRLPE